MYLQDLHAAKGAGVIGLSAPLGEEGGLVQGDIIDLFALGAGEHPGGEPGEVGVVFKQLVHGAASPCKSWWGQYTTKGRKR